MQRVRRTMFNEMNQLDKILPLNQIRLSVWCDAPSGAHDHMPDIHHMHGHEE